jgi:hypothetical protein
MKELILSILGLIGTVLGYITGHNEAIKQIKKESDDKISKVYNKQKERIDVIDAKYDALRVALLHQKAGNDLEARPPEGASYRHRYINEDKPSGSK